MCKLWSKETRINWPSIYSFTHFCGKIHIAYNLPFLPFYSVLFNGIQWYELLQRYSSKTVYSLLHGEENSISTKPSLLFPPPWSNWQPLISFWPLNLPVLYNSHKWVLCIELFSPEIYVEVLTPSISKCKLLWK